jgi:hypothetical protein
MTELVDMANTTMTINGEAHMLRRVNINYIIIINDKSRLQICLDYKLLYFDSINGLIG